MVKPSVDSANAPVALQNKSLLFLLVLWGGMFFTLGVGLASEVAVLRRVGKAGVTGVKREIGLLQTRSLVEQTLPIQASISAIK